jgi:uroporphyrinogen-III synthase
MQVLITRDTDNLEPFGSYLRQCGFAPTSVPLIETQAITIPENTLPQILQVPSGGQLVWVFSSAQGVLFLAQAIKAESVSPSISFVAQGDATAQAISRYFGEGCHCTVSPVRTSKEMGELLHRIFPQDHVSFIVFGPTERSRGCEEVLRLANRRVGVVSVYETRGRRASEEERCLVEQFYTSGTVVFFSPSAVRSWVANGFQSPRRIASFGPVTSEAIVSYGMVVAFESTTNSLEEFARTLRNYRDRV